MSRENTPSRRDRARKPWIGRRLARDREGAAAVEFAMVAAPFLFMLMAIIELGVIFMLDTAFENAVAQTGRLVRTGQAHERSMTVADFKAEVCERMGLFQEPCSKGLMVDVRVLERFTGATPPLPLNEDGEISEAGLRFAIGGPGDIVLLSAWYPQTVFSPFIRQGTEKTGEKRLLNVTTAFRNEPFGS